MSATEHSNDFRHSKREKSFSAKFLRLFILVIVSVAVVCLLKESISVPAEQASSSLFTVPGSTASSVSSSPTETTDSSAPVIPTYLDHVPTFSEMESDITNLFLDINPYSREGELRDMIDTIVIHYVANPGSSALANRQYFNNLQWQGLTGKDESGKTYASSHYIIGLDGEIIRCIPDDEIAFHAGNADVNRRSIGIEVCHPDDSGKYTDATYRALVRLVSYLCVQYDIPLSGVIRHYDVTGKLCPAYYVSHPDEWALFKSRLLFS